MIIITIWERVGCITKCSVSPIVISKYTRKLVDNLFKIRLPSVTSVNADLITEWEWFWASQFEWAFFFNKVYRFGISYWAIKITLKCIYMKLMHHYMKNKPKYIALKIRVWETCSFDLFVEQIHTIHFMYSSLSFP
jgi:hypothetical protein